MQKRLKMKQARDILKMRGCGITTHRFVPYELGYNDMGQG
jgi:hypothetical protein